MNANVWEIDREKEKGRVFIHRYLAIIADFVIRHRNNRIVGFVDQTFCIVFGMYGYGIQQCTQRWL